VVRLTYVFKGKSIAAKLYANFLMSIQAVPGSRFAETTTSGINHLHGIHGTIFTLGDISHDGGGVSLSSLNIRRALCADKCTRYFL